MDNAVPPDFTPVGVHSLSVTGRPSAATDLSPPKLGNDFAGSVRKLAPTACSLWNDFPLLLSVFAFISVYHKMILVSRKFEKVFCRMKVNCDLFL